MATSTPVKKLMDNAQIIGSKGVHCHTIIWIYGLGGNSDGYTDIFTKAQPPNTRIIIPNAPKRWVDTKGRKYYLESWWESDETCPKEGLIYMEKLKELIDDEIKLVKDASHIIIGGFSQGGILSLITGLTYAKQPLGGVISCSGALIAPDIIIDQISDYAKQIPFLILHGKDDHVFEWEEVKPGLELIKTKGVNDNMEILIEDGVGHQISPQAFNLINKFVMKQFKI